MQNPYKHIPVLLGLFCAVLLALPSSLRADGPAPSVIQRMIDTAYHGGTGKIVIPPGTYHVKPQEDCHLRLVDMKDFEVDATGVTLIFTDPAKWGIFFDNCENVSFHGATILRDPVSFSQGAIESVALLRNAFDVRIARGYPAAIDDAKAFPTPLMVGLFDAKTRQWKPDAKDYWASKVEKLSGDGSGDLFRFHLDKPLLPGTPLGTGDLVAWRGNGAADLSLRNCRRMNFAGVTVKSGGGFAVYDLAGDDNHYTGLTVTRGPAPDGADEEPLLAANADGFHSNGARKGPTLENCLIEDTDDDGIAIHGVYARVLGAAGKQVLIGDLEHPFCIPGDTLRFTGLQGEIVGEGKVVSVETQAGYKPSQPAPPDLRLFQNPPFVEYQNVVLDREVAAVSGGMVSNADACGNGFTIRNCTVRNNRARGMLLKAGGLVEGSTVEGSTMGGIIVSPEIGEWNEAGYASGLIVRKNVIRHAGIWHQPGNPMAGALTVAAYEHGRFVPLPGGHHGILITGNKFEENDGVNLLVSSASDVTIADNQFVRPMRNTSVRGTTPGVDAGALIWLSECEGVKVSGVTVTEPGSALKKNVVTAGMVHGTGF
jgi:hypothetical protein